MLATSLGRVASCRRPLGSAAHSGAGAIRGDTVRCVSFFEPAPPPEPPSERAWSSPLWDRPSEGTVPAVLPVNALLHVGPDAVVALQSLSVYPNGFVINFFSLANPYRSNQPHGMSFIGGIGGPDILQRFPRVGVRFADGRTGGREVAPSELEKDADGIPTRPIVQLAGGGGGSHGYAYSVWVFPLPPDGPLDVFVSVPALDIEESQVTIDGATVRAAAANAHPIWT
jgi:hypothetical protein